MSGAYTVPLEDVIAFATRAHAGQTRKDGTPAILHALRVMTLVGTQSSGISVIKAAVLHDVVEDTDIDIIQIRDRFVGRVAGLVELMTRHPGDDKQVDLDSVMSDPNSAIIKVADRIDNLSNGLHTRSRKWLARYIESSRSIAGHIYRHPSCKALNMLHPMLTVLIDLAQSTLDEG